MHDMPSECLGPDTHSQGTKSGGGLRYFCKVCSRGSAGFRSVRDVTTRSLRAGVRADAEGIGAAPGDALRAYRRVPLAAVLSHLAPVRAVLGDVAAGDVRAAGGVEVTLADVAARRVAVEED